MTFRKVITDRTDMNRRRNAPISGFNQNDPILTKADRRLQLAGNVDSYDDLNHAISDEDGKFSMKTETLAMHLFNRYYQRLPDEEGIGGTISYVFMIRPDLNLFKPFSSGGGLLDQIKKDPYLAYCAASDPAILLGLTQENLPNEVKVKHHFVPFLMDRVDQYQLPDYAINVNEVTQPFTGFKTQFAGNANASISGQELSISFKDTHNLRILKFFQAWLWYMNGLTLNKFETRDGYKYARYDHASGAQIMDYATSVYYIVTKPDTEIIYFHKQTGLIPRSVDHSSVSFARGENLQYRVEVSFTGGFPEPLNPVTLAEFNYNAGIEDSRDALSEKPAQTYGMHRTGTSWDTPFVGCPYIISNTTTPFKYYLKWNQLFDFN